jgi:hypothetical protein
MWGWVPFGYKFTKFLVGYFIPDLFLVKFAKPNLRILPFLVEIYMESTLRMTNFKILSIFLGS